MGRLISVFLSIGLLTLLAGCGGGGSGSPQNPTPPQAADTTPNAFSFAGQSEATLSAVVTSNEIVISGIDSSASVSITGGEYSIDGGAFVAAAGSVSNNQRIQVRLTSSNQSSTPVNAVLTVGGYLLHLLQPQWMQRPMPFSFNGESTRHAAHG